MKRITLNELSEYTLINTSDERTLALNLSLSGDDDVIKAMVEYCVEPVNSCPCGCCGCEDEW